MCDHHRRGNKHFSCEFWEKVRGGRGGEARAAAEAVFGLLLKGKGGGGGGEAGDISKSELFFFIPPPFCSTEGKLHATREIFFWGGER